MDDMQRWRYFKLYVRILAEFIRCNVKAFAEHIGEMRLRAEAEIHSDIKN